MPHKQAGRGARFRRAAAAGAPERCRVCGHRHGWAAFRRSARVAALAWSCVPSDRRSLSACNDLFSGQVAVVLALDEPLGGPAVASPRDVRVVADHADTGAPARDDRSTHGEAPSHARCLPPAGRWLHPGRRRCRWDVARRLGGQSRRGRSSRALAPPAQSADDRNAPCRRRRRRGSGRRLRPLAGGREV
jgi:hypothetical protein